MDGEFVDQVAVVTGAARGIGRAIAEQLNKQGAHVWLVDCDATGLRTTAESILRPDGSISRYTVIDLADAAAIATLAGEIAASETKVDILINNAGIELDQPFEKVTAEAFDRVIAVNLRAAFLVSQVLAPLFPPAGGAIVNISSIHATHAFPNSIPYACSKAGLVALTRNLALELAPQRIRVNAVCPGYIDTYLWEEFLRTARDPELVASQTEALHPLGRRGLPGDVASAAIYLVSSSAAWVTGTNLVVDGGLTIRAHL